jgi:hypothetical protein
MKNLFPKEIFVAYAVCKKCNNNEFIVDGQTQVCDNCGELMFRTLTRRYNLESITECKKQGKTDNKDKIIFPEEFDVAYAYCNAEDCNYKEYVVTKENVTCQYCRKQMKLENKETYHIKQEKIIKIRQTFLF